MENEEIKTSKKRIIGAAFFGLLLGSYLNKSFEYTLPRIFSIIKKVSIEEGYEIYADSVVLSLALTVLAVFFAGGVAGFLARKKGILVGLLANSVSIILLGFLFVFSILSGENVYYVDSISIQLYSFIVFILVIIASIFGGYFGQKCYSPERDLDLDKNRLTVFGIRWFHYFWILPLIIYSFLATAIIVIYASILVFLADFYYAIHPSIWFSSWIIYFLIMPFLAMIAIYVLGLSFAKFWELMQYGQTKSRGWGRFGKVLLYGIGAPVLSFFIAGWVADITHNMPRPTAGDWKIGIGLILVIPTIALIAHIFSWIKNKFSRKNNL